MHIFVSVLSMSFLKNHPVPFSLYLVQMRNSLVGQSSSLDTPVSTVEILTLLYWPLHAPPSVKASELAAPFFHGIPRTLPSAWEQWLYPAAGPDRHSTWRKGVSVTLTRN